MSFQGPNPLYTGMGQPTPAYRDTADWNNVGMRYPAPPPTPYSYAAPANPYALGPAATANPYGYASNPTPSSGYLGVYSGTPDGAYTMGNPTARPLGVYSGTPDSNYGMGNPYGSASMGAGTTANPFGYASNPTAPTHSLGVYSGTPDGAYTMGNPTARTPSPYTLGPSTMGDGGQGRQPNPYTFTPAAPSPATRLPAPPRVPMTMSDDYTTPPHMSPGSAQTFPSTMGDGGTGRQPATPSYTNPSGTVDRSGDGKAWYDHTQAGQNTDGSYTSPDVAANNRRWQESQQVNPTTGRPNWDLTSNYGQYKNEPIGSGGTQAAGFGAPTSGPVFNLGTGQWQSGGGAPATNGGTVDFNALQPARYAAGTGGARPGMGIVGDTKGGDLSHAEGVLFTGGERVVPHDQLMQYLQGGQAPPRYAKGTPPPPKAPPDSGPVGTVVTNPPASATSTVGPDIVLGPDGNVYGFTRNFDAQANNGKGAYTYDYFPLGPDSDLQAVSAKSGIPLGQLQATIQQQQVTLSGLNAQQATNPYGPNGWSQQTMTQQLDALRTAQQYQTAASNQRQTGINGMTVSQLGDLNNGLNTVNDYQTNMWKQGPSQVAGMSNQDLQLAGTGYGNQRSYLQGQNYNTANPYTGMTNGQTQLAAGNLGDTTNVIRDTYQLTPSDYSGGQSRIAFNQATADKQAAYDATQSGYNLANQGANNRLNDLQRQYETGARTYDTGTAGYTNGQTRQQYEQGTQDLTNPLNRADAAYKAGAADYTNGQSRQQYLQGTEDLTNPYNRADAAFKLAQQPAQQRLDAYRTNLATQQGALMGQSRNLNGLDWASVGRPSVAGWQ